MKSKILKLATLVELGACESQTGLFKEKFGESVQVTEELCEKVAALFDFDWAARHLLTAPARAEYERVRALARAEYARRDAQACVEYECATAPACAEYERVRVLACAESERVMAQVFAKLYIGDPIKASPNSGDEKHG